MKCENCDHSINKAYWSNENQQQVCEKCHDEIEHESSFYCLSCLALDEYDCCCDQSE